MFEAYKNRETGKHANYFSKKKLLELQILKLFETEDNHTLDESLIKSVKVICQICSASELTSGFFRLKECLGFIEKNRLGKAEWLAILSANDFLVLKSFFYTNYKMILLDKDGEPYDWNPTDQSHREFFLAAAKSNNASLLKSYFEKINEKNRDHMLAMFNFCVNFRNMMLDDNKALTPVFVRERTYAVILNSVLLKCCLNPSADNLLRFFQVKYSISNPPLQNYYKEDFKNKDFLNDYNEAFNVEIKYWLYMVHDEFIDKEDFVDDLNGKILAQPFLKIDEETLRFITEKFGEETKNYVLEKMEEALEKADNQVNSYRV